MTASFNSTIARVSEWLADSSAAVVFTGAGISTESGIPDFRSPGGIWTKYRPVYFQEFLADADARHEYWLQKAEGHAQFASARPNAGHLRIAAWEAAGHVRGVVTQNIDGLHQLAGSQQVLELHGNVRQVQCLDCGASFDAGPMVERFQQLGRVPDCPDCGEGRLKHATISFGQALPADVLREAAAWCRRAELTLAIGSSLVVTPAADLPAITKRNGGRLVIINRDPTPLDSLADAVIHGSISDVLSSLTFE
jgi:NAD-dependent deacetylase